MGTNITGSVASAPSGNALTYNDLRTEIADDLGWTRDSANWSSDKSDRLNSVVNAGYWQFLYPVPLEGESASHRWSFLKPNTSFDTVADDYLYDMAANFGAMIGDLVYSADEYVHRSIERVTPGMIDKERAINSISGLPYLYALRPKSTAMTSAQVTELMLYPTPDAVYGIEYYYDAKVDLLSVDNQYPLGGQTHSETILQSCRDIAASRYKDDTAGREHAIFLERLKASVEMDRTLSPKTLGFNKDGTKITHLRHGSDFTVTMTNNFGA